jgi:predicted peptidase
MATAGMGILYLTLIVADLRPDFVALFEAHQHEARLGGRSVRLNYRLFVPEIKEGSARQLPLIVWLHGNGEGGSDNVNQLKWLDTLIFRPPRQRRRFPFFLLAVQCPVEQKSWTRAMFRRDRNSSDALDATKQIVEQLTARQPIDVDRIYLSGVSDGGTACWELAWRYPNMFAAVAPLGSFGHYRADLARLKDVPIWAFHSRDDRWADVNAVRSTVASLQSLGGRVYLTEIDSSGHDCWTAAFGDHGLLSWLLTQRRGCRGLAPGNSPIAFRLRHFVAGWRWWQAALQLGMFGAFGLAGVRLTRAVRRFHRASAGVTAIRRVGRATAGK